MTWLRLDDRFAEHPKIVALSDAAFRLHVEGLCYAARNTSNGFVPKRAMASAIATAFDELLQLGIWNVADGGYDIHDYLDWNPSKEEVDELRQARIEAGEKGAASRWGSKSHGKSSGKGHSKSNGKTMAKGVGEDRGYKALDSKEKGVDFDFELFWDAYPYHVGKIAARKALATALQVASLDEIVSGAKRFRDDPNRDPKFTPHPSKWLNQGQWEDDPLPSAAPTHNDNGGMTREGLAAALKSATPSPAALEGG